MDPPHAKHDIPVVPIRKPIPKHNEAKAFPSVIVPAKKPKVTSIPEQKQTQNYSSRLSNSEWEELGNILRPGFPFHLGSGNSTNKNSTKNSTLTYTPKPHQSLKVKFV